MKIIDRTQNMELCRQVPCIRRFRTGGEEDSELNAAVEHMMDVSVNGEAAMRMVCTPNLLPELVLGRLYTEGMISTAEDVVCIELSGDGERCNVTLNKPAEKKAMSPVTPIHWEDEWIYRLAEKMEGVTPLFIATHAVHSCYLGREGEILYCCEDLGRHNAMDKVVGSALRDKVDLTKCILFTSGRMPTDMVMKAIRAGVPVLASKTVPTDRGIALAEQYGLTLIAFGRSGRLTVVTGDRSRMKAEFCGSGTESK